MKLSSNRTRGAEKALCSQWLLQKPLITGWQAIIELPGEGKQLIVRKAEVLPDSLQHDVHNELHSVGEGGIGQLIHHQQEEFADGPVVLVEAFLQGKQHVSDENQRHMSVQRIIGQAVALRAQVQHGLAGFEEHFDVPTLAVDAQNLLRLDPGICADKGDPVFPFVPVADANDPGRKCVSAAIRQRHID